MSIFRRQIIILLLLISTLRAGEYADAFLLASYYPQTQSLGYSTVATNVNSGHAMNNPAGFAQSSGSQLVLVYDQFGALSNNIGLEAKFKTNGYYNYGLTLVHSMVDGLFARPNLSNLSPNARRDSVFSLQDRRGEKINYREDALFFSIARTFEFEINLGWKFFRIPCRMPVGLSIKYLDKILVDNRGLGSGFDFGGQLYFDLAGMTDVLLNTEFSIGLFFSDILNTPVYWSTEHQDAIKRVLVRGVGITQHIEKFHSELTLTRSVHSRYKNIQQYGLEAIVKEAIYLRAGHDGNATSLGLGIGLKKFIIDYSFSQHELAGVQKIGISYHF